MKVHPVGEPLSKSRPELKAIGLNSRLAALLKSMFDRSMSCLKESVTPGILSVTKVLEAKEFEKASE
jgi:hypothetical protein